MDVLKIFVAFLLFAIAAVVEAPYFSRRRSRDQRNPQTGQRRPPSPQQQHPSQGHHQQRAHSPSRGSINGPPPSPRDPIPTLPDDRGTSVYGSQSRKVKNDIQFYSKDNDMDFDMLKGKWRTTVRYWSIVQDKGNMIMGMRTPFAKLKKVAANHLVAYADFWHGWDIQPYGKKWGSTDSDIKRILRGKHDETWHMNAYMQTTDGALEMCCNVLLRMKVVKRFNYAMGCAQPACFRIRKSASRRRNYGNMEKCYFLNIVKDIKTMEYPSCLKEV